MPMSNALPLSASKSAFMRGTKISFKNAALRAFAASFHGSTTIFG